MRALVPELKIHLGDVRKLEFPDASFDGYWSLGVIEHFPVGYDAIAHEMHRVLKPGGYLFLTFPALSPLRRLKAYFKAYPLFEENNFDFKNFYQFALNQQDVLRTFENVGFEAVKKKRYEGLKGLKDESGSLKPFFQMIYDNKSLFGKILSHSLSLVFAPVASHMSLLILKKK